MTYRSQSDVVLRRRAVELWGVTRNAVKWLRAQRRLDERHLWILRGGPQKWSCNGHREAA